MGPNSMLLHRPFSSCMKKLDNKTQTYIPYYKTKRSHWKKDTLNVVYSFEGLHTPNCKVALERFCSDALPDATDDLYK